MDSLNGIRSNADQTSRVNLESEESRLVINNHALSLTMHSSDKNAAVLLQLRIESGYERPHESPSLSEKAICCYRVYL